MKSLEDVKNQRPDLYERWQALASKVVDRKEQFDKFVRFLENKTWYFEGPASTKYHLCEEFGLLQHSLNVAENALKIKNVLMPAIADESVIICALFHDLGKATTTHGKPKYIKNEPTEKQKKYGYGPTYPYSYQSDEGIFLTVPQISVWLLSKFIDISVSEYQAILVHDGQYVDENHPYAAKENPLALILHYGDSWSGFVIEKEIL